MSVNKSTRIEVPAVAWWVLIALLIPVLQVWIGETFPGSTSLWAPLVVAVLGAVLKWISWVMAQNGQETPTPAAETEEEGTIQPAGAMRLDESGVWLYRHEPRRFDVADFLFGIKKE